jgi:DNA polymerase III subunit epsilon
VLDTLAMARERFPGQRNSLDALCRRFGVDASQREVHGALLDASLLAEVYLALTAGQGDLGFATEAPATAVVRREVDAAAFALRVLRASDDELSAHRARLDVIERASRGACAWLRLEPAAVPEPA